MIELTSVLWKDCSHDYAWIIRGKHDPKTLQRDKRIFLLRERDFLDYIKSNHIDVVIIHYFYSVPFSLIPQIPLNVKVLWFAWGYDLYFPLFQHRPLICRSLIHPETRRILKGDIISRLKTWVKIVGYKRYQRTIEDAIARIDFFSGVIPDEYELIIKDKHNYFFRAVPLNFTYTDIHNTIESPEDMSTLAEGFNIQIGNSGDPSNNHVDVFYKLKEYGIIDKKIYVPLSYSGTKYYVSRVLKEGKRLFGDNFVPLKEFMPLKDYERILSSSGYAIFFHERQQAIGNIYSALGRGCMVFISETSPVYDFLKRIGYVFYTIQHDLRKIVDNEKLTTEQILINRRLLAQNFSVESESNKAVKILNALKQP